MILPTEPQPAAPQLSTNERVVGLSKIIAKPHSILINGYIDAIVEIHPELANHPFFGILQNYAAIAEYESAELIRDRNTFNQNDNQRLIFTALTGNVETLATDNKYSLNQRELASQVLEALQKRMTGLNDGAFYPGFVDTLVEEFSKFFDQSFPLMSKATKSYGRTGFGLKEVFRNIMKISQNEFGNEEAGGPGNLLYLDYWWKKFLYQ